VAPLEDRIRGQSGRMNAVEGFLQQRQRWGITQARARMPRFTTGLAGQAQQGRQWESRVVLAAAVRVSSQEGF